jgi:DNA-binding transcriptional LysR family regulator
MKKLQEIDLNLLVTFKLLYQERKISSVANILGLSQAAVSNALNRLRKSLNDELFYRSARGMAPTQLANELAEPILYALSNIEHSINFNNQFNPQTSSRRFCIAMTDIGETYFLPALMSYLAKEAKHVHIETQRSQSHKLPELMESGEIDLALGLLPRLDTGFYQRRLFSLNYVCLMRKNHPKAQSELTIEALCNSDHVVVTSEGTGHAMIERILIDQGLPGPVRLRVPDFVSVAYILNQSDLIATVPVKLAEKAVKPFDLIYKSHPMKMPTIQVNAFWHRRFHHDAANKWLRDIMVQLFAE